MGLVDRAFLLSSPKFHQKNIITVIETLLNNDYPVDLVFNVINERLKSLRNKKTSRQTAQPASTADEPPISWFPFPFVAGVSCRLKRLLKNLNVNMAFFSLNKLNCCIKAQKDRLGRMSKKNVVYKIHCKDCDATYVGQTKRTLNTRIKEHKNDIRKTSGNFSVVSEHRINFDHDFCWNDVEILDNERFSYKRQIAEMLHINLQNHSLNLQSDTEFLHHSYVSLLNEFR
ncbi:hypothetical protein ALC62_14318 [Cyphomyrmex costatus]|uniref:GIY-YIG domain-containing protein n=2 Tax=Cyphomyrmex costatus TaxID=456900 RepID=A0A151I8U5_9HYME|nr:hypothetical protein ALC62_14318 [Cyphomyrmex costatus]